jgi:hypothetical protein
MTMLDTSTGSSAPTTPYLHTDSHLLQFVQNEIMAHSYSKTRRHRSLHEGALRLFDKDDTDGSIAAAQRNLIDPTLPPYYFIKYHTLITSVMDDWRDADHHRLVAVRWYMYSLHVKLILRLRFCTF